MENFFFLCNQKLESKVRTSLLRMWRFISLKSLLSFEILSRIGCIYYPSRLKYLIRHFIIVFERHDEIMYGNPLIDIFFCELEPSRIIFQLELESTWTINYSFSHGHLEWRRVLTRKSVFSTIIPVYTLNILASKFIPVERKKKFDFSKNSFKMPDKKFEPRRAVWG